MPSGSIAPRYWAYWASVSSAITQPNVTTEISLACCASIERNAFSMASAPLLCPTRRVIPGTVGAVGVGEELAHLRKGFPHIGRELGVDDNDRAAWICRSCQIEHLQRMSR